MKIVFRITLMFLICFFAKNSLSARSSLVEFKDISLEEAVSQGQKIFVSFSAEWCLPCKIIEESIYSDPEIASLLNKNFVAIKADVDSHSGNQWNELYNANYLPTTLFASKKGKELNRFNGVPSRQEFLNELKRILALSRFVPVRTQGDFIVQVGAYSSISNAEKMVAKLAISTFNNSVIYQELQSSGKVIFKVLLTDYVTRDDAVRDLRIIKKKGFDGFVKRKKT